MSEETKLHIIKTGADIIHRKGFNNTGIQEILKASGVPKGSFYYYFDSKEAFGVEVVKYFFDHFAELVGPVLKDKSHPPLERLKMFFRVFRDYYEEHDWSRGCPIGNLAQEMGDLSEQLQTELSLLVNRMAQSLVPVIEEAKSLDQLPEQLDSASAAGFIIGAWHGALVQMKVNKNGKSLDNFERYVFGAILVK